MSKYALLTFSGLVIALTSGCGKVSLDLSGFLPISALNFSKGAEFVAASQTGQKTAHGYTVDSSVGSVYPTLEATTAHGYKVYSSVQGSLLSEEEQ